MVNLFVVLMISSDRYVGWTEQTFPHGGKESNLSTLLECVVKKFTDEKKYHNDPRYVDLWIKFVCLEFLNAPNLIWLPLKHKDLFHMYVCI